LSLDDVTFSTQYPCVFVPHPLQNTMELLAYCGVLMSLSTVKGLCRTAETCRWDLALRVLRRMYSWRKNAASRN